MRPYIYVEKLGIADQNTQIFIFLFLLLCFFAKCASPLIVKNPNPLTELEFLRAFNVNKILSLNFSAKSTA